MLALEGFKGNQYVWVQFDSSQNASFDADTTASNYTPAMSAQGSSRSVDKTYFKKVKLLILTLTIIWSAIERGHSEMSTRINLLICIRFMQDG